MRSSTLATFAVTLSLAAAIPMNSTQADSHNKCSPARVKSTVYMCAARTEMTPVECFGTMCAKMDLSTIRKQNTKRATDPLKCSDQNLFNCTIRDWRDAGDCFREFCL